MFPEIINNKALAHLSNIQKIEVAEYLMMRMEGAITESPPLQHFICNDTYTRQILLPKGIVLTGCVHNFDHTNIISMGEVTIFTPEGKEHRRAVESWVSPAGTKRLIYVHEETIWTTIHQAHGLTDPEQIRDIISHVSDTEWVAKSGLIERLQ